MRDLSFPIQKGEQAQASRCETTGDLTRSCKCPKHLGARNKRKGREKQRAAARGLRIPKSRFASQMGHEENLRGPVRIEVKAGKQVEPIATRFLAYEKQSEDARPVGDYRPFVAVAMPDGWASGIVMFRLADLDAFIAAYSDEVGA